MAFVNLSKMPDPRQEYTVNFGNLNGGLNLSELEYRLKNTESPEMKNLLWREGVLCCRDGQVKMLRDPFPSTVFNVDIGKAMYERLFHGYVVAHIHNGLYACRVGEEEPEWVTLYELSNPMAHTEAGAFFVYNGDLYYKIPGFYFKIEYDDSTGTLSGGQVSDYYTPITLINADPDTGAGDLYQPENRLNAKKTVWFNAKWADDQHTQPVADYHLPVNATSVDKVVVDGSETTDYTYSNGVVHFNSAPPVTDPPTNNTVQITYVKANTDAYNSVMDCAFAATYGGTGNLCVVMGGCPAQPNAIFWNAIGYGAAMDPTYFPMEQYQFCGDASDPVTGFGKQQSFLVVFNERSVGRVKQDTQTIDDRLTIDMPYVAINDKIGCDMPTSIQLIENNLVWCNTDQGVHILKDSSYAYENNIECVSKKINGGATKRGLLDCVRKAQHISSMDDSKRYWLCCDGECWVWDYETTTYKDPSWYYMTNIYAVAFATEYENVWHVNAKGELSRFARNWMDYDGPIDKSYRFAMQYFGGYDRLKNVNSVVIVMRADTNSTAQLQYITDYEERWDLSPLVHLAWALVPRDLSYRILSGRGFGASFRRKPMCRRIRHFTMKLYNNVIGQDLNIVSAQVFYNYQGRTR